MEDSIAPEGKFNSHNTTTLKSKPLTTLIAKDPTFGTFGMGSTGNTTYILDAKTASGSKIKNIGAGENNLILLALPHRQSNPHPHLPQSPPLPALRF